MQESFPMSLLHTRLHWAALCLLLGCVWVAGCATREPSPLSPVTEFPAKSADVSFVKQSEALSESNVWLLEDAIRRAIECNGPVNALRIAVSVAEQRRKAATDIADPELQFGSGRGDSDSFSSRSSSRETVSRGTAEQTAQSTRQETETQTGAGGVPVSTSTGSQTMTERSQSASGEKRVGYSSTTETTSESGDSWRIDARFFLPNPWLIVPRVNARKAEIMAARADLHAAIWNVTCEVRRLFAELYYLNADIELATRQVDLNAEIMKIERSRSEQGVGIVSDLLTASQRYLQAQENLEKAIRFRKLAQRELGALLDISALRIQTPTNELEFAVSSKAVAVSDETMAVAIRSRGDLAALQWRLAAAKAAYREVYNVRMPWIKEIRAGYRSSADDSLGSELSQGSSRESGSGTRTSTGSGYAQSAETAAADGKVVNTEQYLSEQEQASSSSSSSSSDFGRGWSSSREDSEEWWVLLAVDIPIFSWTINHEESVARAEYELAGVNAAEGMRLVGREVRDAFDEWNDCREELANHNEKVVPIVAEMRESLDTLKNASNSLPDQVAGREAQIVESMRLGLGVRRRLQLALINLERVLGTSITDLP